ncbi:MAG: PAS domain-containing protein [Fodinibius sp.]|nr:PAS domain-containing protein [Fodinibius sp.]
MSENQSANTALERYRLAIRGIKYLHLDWMDITEKEQWWSPQFYQMLGYKEGAIDSTIDTFKELLHPEDTERVMDALGRHIETGESMVLEYRLQTKSGSYKWFEASGQVEVDKEGNPYRMAGNMLDIDDRKQAEMQVEKERTMLRTIIDNIPVNVYVKNEDGEKVLANKSEYELWGFDSEEEIIGKTDADLSRDG